MKISLKKICKIYSLKTALKDVTVSFEAGKIHMLLGENGAGKSTLANIISGDIVATSGEIFLDKKKTIFNSTKDSLEQGIVLVHQRPLLANDITAKENIFLGENRLFRINQSSNLTALKKKWAPLLNLNSLVKDLSADSRFYTSLLCALLRNPSCLILDEPSALLDLEQRINLYKNLKSLASSGCNIIVITHSTAEASTYADTVTILQEGKFFASFNSAKEYSSYLLEKNISPLENDLSLNKTRTASVSENSKTSEQTTLQNTNRKHCLVLENVSSRPKSKPALLNASFTVDFSSITIISGMLESALGTLEDVVTGESASKANGIIRFNSKENPSEKTFSLSKNKFTSSFLRKNKTAIVPSDRTFIASNPDLTVEQMMTVYCKQTELFSKKNSLKKIAEDLIKKAQVNVAPEEKCSSLSGGMLQRLILVREQTLCPDLFILCEPMQGLDTNAQREICKTLISFSKEGKAILILGATDFPLSICDKVYSIEGGTTTLAFERNK